MIGAARIARSRVCACACVCVRVRARACACAWAPAVGMTHLGVLYSGTRAPGARQRIGMCNDVLVMWFLLASGLLPQKNPKTQRASCITHWPCPCARTCRTAMCITCCAAREAFGNHAGHTAQRCNTPLLPLLLLLLVSRPVVICAFLSFLGFALKLKVHLACTRCWFIRNVCFA